MTLRDQGGDDTSPFRVNSDVIYNQTGEEAVLVNMKTNQIYELNRTGARFWELLSAGYDRTKIQQLMLQEFDVAEDALVVEIEAMITTLEAEGLIIPSE